MSTVDHLGIKAWVYFPPKLHVVENEQLKMLSVFVGCNDLEMIFLEVLSDFHGRLMAKGTLTELNKLLAEEQLTWQYDGFVGTDKINLRVSRPGMDWVSFGPIEVVVTPTPPLDVRCYPTVAGGYAKSNLTLAWTDPKSLSQRFIIEHEADDKWVEFARIARGRGWVEMPYLAPGTEVNFRICSLHDETGFRSEWVHATGKTES